MKKPRRILVGLKTLEQAVALTDIACRLAAKNASLILAHVIELPEPTPLDVKLPDLELAAQKLLKAGGRVARRSGLKVDTRVLRARNAGYALLDEMTICNIELAVIGYHHERSLGERLLGTTAEHLSKKAPCPLVCVIPPHP